MKATALLAPGLLEGVSLLLAGAGAGGLGDEVAAAFAELGGRVSTCVPDAEDEAALDRAVTAAGAIDVLVVDGAALFARGAGSPLRDCLDSAWNVTRATINHAFLPAGRGGRIVYLAPLDGPARAALENLARTLSVEWARHGVNVVTVAGGSATVGAALGALCAYLASPAGAYFSGCLLELDGGR